MAKIKVTISVAAEKVEAARRITEAASTSAAIEAALDVLIAIDRVRNDIAAYLAIPPTAEEIALASYRAPMDDIDDGTDWEAMFPEAE